MAQSNTVRFKLQKKVVRYAPKYVKAFLEVAEKDVGLKQK